MKMHIDINENMRNKMYVMTYKNELKQIDATIRDNIKLKESLQIRLPTKHDRLEHLSIYVRHGSMA